jgi:hypothetical protein
MHVNPRSDADGERLEGSGECERSLRHTTLQKLAGHVELWLWRVQNAYILVGLANVRHFCGIRDMSLAQELGTEVSGVGGLITRHFSMTCTSIK